MALDWVGKVGAVLSLTAICVSAAPGQVVNVVDTTGRGGRKSPACNGEIVTRIDILSQPPFEQGGPKFAQRLAHFVTNLHATSKPSLIRRFLALEVGGPCTDFRVQESERILRAQPYLADATVYVIPDGDNAVAIEVTTVDEVSLVVDGSFAGKSPIVRALRLGEENLDGRGVSVTSAWQKGIFYRDIYKARVVDYQLFGRPYQLSLQGSRNEIGGSWDALLDHPFYTDLQRTSWRLSAGSNTGYLYFIRPNAPEVALNFTRTYSDVGGVISFGPIGRLFLVGATFSRERERTNHNPVQVADSAIIPDTSSALIGRYSDHSSSRVNLLLGFRNVHFLRVKGFDAVEGTEDVRTGFQVAALIGRGFLMTPGDEEDYFVSTDVYAGTGNPHSFTGIEVLSERRRDIETRQWDGILASGRAARYDHITDKHTTIFDVEYSGGWKQRVPFQVTFQDRDGGLLGYGSSELGGAQRLVSRLEDRYLLGNYRQFAGLAGAVFVQAGKLWAGDVPFGTTTDVKYSAGIGLLAALPPRSRRTWRVDLAVPLNDRGDAKWEIRFTNHDFTRWFWREPGDVQTSRERSIPNSVYNWP